MKHLDKFLENNKDNVSYVLSGEQLDIILSQSNSELKVLCDAMARILYKHLEIKQLKLGGPISEEYFSEVYGSNETREILKKYEKQRSF